MVYEIRQFNNGEIYHVVLKAIDDNLLFKDTNDYYRGIFSIYEFNTIQPITIQERRKARLCIKKLASDSSSNTPPIDKRDKFVEIFAFCLMPNHLHLLLKQLKDEGISRFMQKIGGGYAGYFNRKYKRRGHLFQDRFTAVHIENDNQLRNVFVYVHTNPIASIEPNWKENGIKNPARAIEFIENYKWSSYQDYLGKKNFPSVTERDFLREVMGGPDKARADVNDWIQYKGEISEESAYLVLE